MSEQDWVQAKEYVRGVHGTAESVSKHYVCEIRCCTPHGRWTLGSGPTREAAWIDAAQHLKSKTEAAK